MTPRRALASLLAAVLAGLVGVVAVRTAGFGPPAMAVPDLPPPVEVDPVAAGRRLAAALAIATVAPARTQGDAPLATGEDAFARFRALLATAFPAVNRSLAREVLGGGSLLLTWPGRDPTLDPVLVSAHMDVVPASGEGWTHPPFAGVIEGGFVWGRGALDMKQGLIAWMEAAEALLKAGYRPDRTILFAFGHDEETAGSGAAAIAGRLAAQGIRLEATIDEGLSITSGLVPGLKAPVALIGLAQKGYLTLGLSVEGPGGHAAMPPADPVAVRLARALVRLDAAPMPARIDGATAAMFRWLGPHLPLAERVALANPWLFRPLLVARLAPLPAANAMIRTTLAPTTVALGSDTAAGWNLLPRSGRAVIDLRLLPGETLSGVEAEVARRIGDPAIALTRLGPASEPSGVASTGSRAFAVLVGATRAVFPDAVVAPGLLVSTTDSRAYAALARDSYFFLPSRLGPEDLARIHGTDERIALADHADLIRFCSLVLQGWGSR